jgi:hypothetical protein
MSGYYVLGQEGEPVLIHLRDEPSYGKVLALAVYTAQDGGQQREDLQHYKDTSVLPMSAEEILAVIPSGSCSTVFLDGKKLARSVFEGMLKTELELPIKHHRLVRLDE